MIKRQDGSFRSAFYDGIICHFGGCHVGLTGHGVGLDIHEYPTVSPRCDTILKEGMIVTIEPGIYIKDNFGVRIEDTVIVTENGYKSFASLPKELTIL